MPEPQFSASEQGYMLTTGSYLARCRLNHQYHVWREVLKFNIHPLISASFPTDRPVRIVEAGCGTGSWMIYTALENPNYEITGLDLSIDQAPPKGWLPPNVKELRTFNLLDEIPEDLLGKFDLVHVRLFILVIQNSDPRPMIRNLRKLLRPGGWLQWEDHDPNDLGSYFVDDQSQHELSATDKLLELFHNEGRNTWIPQLADTMASEGFDQTLLEKFDDPPHLRQCYADLTAMMMAEFVDRLRITGKAEEALKAQSITIDAMNELRNQDGAVFVRRILAMGRHPG